MLSVYTGLYVFARLIGMFSTAPSLAGGGVPAARVALAVLVTAMTAGWSRAPAPVPADGWAMTGALVGETLLGAALGGLLSLFFAAFQTAGHVIGNQLGFGWAEIYDPRTRDSVDLFAGLYQKLGLLLFFLLDGPWRLLHLTVGSFQLIGPGQAVWSGRAAGLWVEGLSRSMALAAAAAAPTVGALWLASLLVGFLGRAAPNMNLWAIDFPFRLLIGLASLWVGATAAIRLFPTGAAAAFERMGALLKILAG